MLGLIHFSFWYTSTSSKVFFLYDYKVQIEKVWFQNSGFKDKVINIQYIAAIYLQKFCRQSNWRNILLFSDHVDASRKPGGLISVSSIAMHTEHYLLLLMNLSCQNCLSRNQVKSSWHRFGIMKVAQSAWHNCVTSGFYQGCGGCL